MAPIPTFLEQARRAFHPARPRSLQAPAGCFQRTSPHLGIAPSLRPLFPHLLAQEGAEQLWVVGQGPHPLVRRPLRVAVLFSGGPAPGGHNVVAGLYDALQQFDAHSSLLGILGGPSGLVEGKSIELTRSALAPYRNQGGFDLLGSGRTKIETPEQLAASLKTARHLALDGIVVVGGDDSNTNAAILAEYFLAHQASVRVIGLPKTIDGDLSHEHIPVSFGFDTACRVYSELIGNLARDALSAKKYTHFVKLMGRSASHIALECALHTHPNLTLIAEEVAAHKWTLAELIASIAESLAARFQQGKNYGVVLIPEGLIEQISEVGQLIQQINSLGCSSSEELIPRLSDPLRACFSSLPSAVQEQLLFDRDPHGNVSVSQIETDRLLIAMVQKKLPQMQAVPHFFGYEGRASFPSHFDTHYTYTLGQVAGVLLAAGATARIATVFNPEAPIADWEVGGVPLVPLMHLEERKGKEKPVIRKQLVDLSGPLFAQFAAERSTWLLQDAYRYPGPLQFSSEVPEEEQLPWALRRRRLECSDLSPLC